MTNELNSSIVPMQSKSNLSEIEKVLEICESLSSYQLYRLKSKLSSMLDEPVLIDQIKSQFSLGDEIEYFSAEENRNIRAILQKHNRSYASISNLENGERWRIPYSWIKVDESEFHAPTRKNKLTRDDIAVGEFIGFTDRQNQERFGTVIRLNPKTVTIDCEDGRSWRVAYSFLFRVIDSAANDSKTEPRQQLLLE